MGQQHNPQDNMKDERTRKAQQDSSDGEQRHGMPGTFKNDPDKPGEKAKSLPKKTSH